MILLISYFHTQSQVQVQSSLFWPAVDLLETVRNGPVVRMSSTVPGGFPFGPALSFGRTDVLILMGDHTKI